MLLIRDLWFLVNPEPSESCVSITVSIVYSIWISSNTKGVFVSLDVPSLIGRGEPGCQGTGPAGATPACLVLFLCRARLGRDSVCLAAQLDVVTPKEHLVELPPSCFLSSFRHFYEQFERTPFHVKGPRMLPREGWIGVSKIQPFKNAETISVGVQSFKLGNSKSER